MKIRFCWLFSSKFKDQKLEFWFLCYCHDTLSWLGWSSLGKCLKSDFFLQRVKGWNFQRLQIMAQLREKNYPRLYSPKFRPIRGLERLRSRRYHSHLTVGKSSRPLYHSELKLWNGKSVGFAYAFEPVGGQWQSLFFYR